MRAVFGRRERARPAANTVRAQDDDHPLGARPEPGLEQQAAFFRTFGACKIPGLFAAEIATIIEGFSEVFRDHEAEAADPTVSLHRVANPEHGTARLQIPANSAIKSGTDDVGFIERSEKLDWIRDDPRITDLVQALLGAGARYIGSVGNVFNSYIYWHSDYFRATVPPDTRLKIAFYLDALDAESGALRVIPGTNHLGTYRSSLFDEAGDSKPGDLERIFGVPEDQLPCLALAVDPGDVIVFDNRILHANFNGGPNRRMFLLQFGEARHDQ